MPALGPAGPAVGLCERVPAEQSDHNLRRTAGNDRTGKDCAVSMALGHGPNNDIHVRVIVGYVGYPLWVKAGHAFHGGSIPAARWKGREEGGGGGVVMQTEACNINPSPKPRSPRLNASTSFIRLANTNVLHFVN